MMMENDPGCRLWSAFRGIVAAMSLTAGSNSGEMPRSMAPRTAPPELTSAWPATYGAQAFTCAFLPRSPATDAQSVIGPRRLTISTWGRIESMRSRTSFWNPFMTERTMMSAMTPTAIEATEIAEMKLMKPSLRRPRRPARVYLRPTSSSKGDPIRAP